MLPYTIKINTLYFEILNVIKNVFKNISANFLVFIQMFLKVFFKLKLLKAFYYSLICKPFIL